MGIIKDKVKITFIGGVGEIGKNMTAFEYKDEMIVLDAGLTFPDEDLPGVDIVVPDISYLLANKHKIKAVLLTHGHEDHIGGLPFLLNEINVPVYGSRLTLGLVENKLKEYPKIKAKLISVKPKNVLKIGSFAIEFIHVNHSIAGALAMCISTPLSRALKCSMPQWILSCSGVLKSNRLVEPLVSRMKYNFCSPFFSQSTAQSGLYVPIGVSILNLSGILKNIFTSGSLSSASANGFSMVELS